MYFKRAALLFERADENANPDCPDLAERVSNLEKSVADELTKRLAKKPPEPWKYRD